MGPDTRRGQLTSSTKRKSGPASRTTEAKKARRVPITGARARCHATVKLADAKGSYAGIWESPRGIPLRRTRIGSHQRSLGERKIIVRRNRSPRRRGQGTTHRIKGETKALMTLLMVETNRPQYSLGPGLDNGGGRRPFRRPCASRHTAREWLQ